MTNKYTRLLFSLSGSFSESFR